MRKVILLAFALPFLAHAQLLEVKQVIYGMDCAPCARGVEASIKKLDGVQVVAISLNNGTALIQLSSDNDLKLQEIRQRVSDNGFTPKEVEVKITGTLREVGDELVIQMTSGETFSLDPTERKGNEAHIRLRARVGQAVTIVGRVPDIPKTELESWPIRVEDVID